ncbi:MAG: DUF481 domain-containing protein [Pseudomonadales bacterium]
MGFRKMLRIPAISILVLLAVSSANASTLIMTNGDRITGTIKKIWGDSVFIEPSYADEFSVDKVEVVNIIDDRQMEVELDDGTELTGTMAVDAAGNQVMIVDGKEIVVPMTVLSELKEPEKFSDWDTRFDVNTALDKGNTDSKSLKLSAYGMYKQDRRRHIFDVVFDTEEQNGVQTKDRDFAQYNFNYEVRDPWFFGTSASYERDPIKNLDYRYNIIPAMGYDIFNDAYRLFSLQVGAGYQAESSVDQNTLESIIDNGGVAAFVMRFSWEFDSPDLEFYVNGNTTQASYGRKNLVTQWVTGIRYDISDLLYLNMEFDYNHESKPSEGAEPEDISLRFGVGVEFGK